MIYHLDLLYYVKSYNNFNLTFYIIRNYKLIKIFSKLNY